MNIIKTLLDIIDYKPNPNFNEDMTKLLLYGPKVTGIINAIESLKEEKVMGVLELVTSLLLISSIKYGILKWEEIVDAEMG